MSNKIYPIGIQNFESLRRDGYHLWKILQTSITRLVCSMLSYPGSLATIGSKPELRPIWWNPRKSYKIGVNFSRETRNIEKWIVEEG